MPYDTPTSAPLEAAASYISDYNRSIPPQSYGPIQGLDIPAPATGMAGAAQPAEGLRRPIYAWEDMTNIEKFDYLKTQLSSLMYKIDTVRDELRTHSHDLQGRPCKPLTY